MCIRDRYKHRAEETQNPIKVVRACKIPARIAMIPMYAGNPKLVTNSGSGILIPAILSQGANPPKAMTTIKYRVAGINNDDKIIIHILLAGKLVSSIIVGVISNPMNFKEKIAIATKPPWFVMLDIDQLPLLKNFIATNREIVTIEKKKILASIPVSLISKLDKIYHSITMLIATGIAIFAGIGIKKLTAVKKMKAIMGGSTT